VYILEYLEAKEAKEAKEEIEVKDVMEVISRILTARGKTNISTHTLPNSLSLLRMLRGPKEQNGSKFI